MSVRGKKARASAAAEALNFEAALQELEALVTQLEAGGLPLEEALGVFERGQVLAARCGQLLDQAELKVRVMPDRPGAALKPLDDEE